MELLARARIVLWEGGGLWVVEATPQASRTTQRTDSHAHHAIQVTIGLGGRFRLDAGDVSVRGDAAAVAPDTAHTFEAEGLVAILFIEPEGRMGRAIARALFDSKSLAAVPAEWLGDFSQRVAAAYRAPVRDDDALVAAGRALVARMAGDRRADVPDLRIRKVIEWAGQQLDGQVSLSDAVAVAKLSAGRLRHLFVEQTGLPFKTYLLWLRLMRAVERYAAGASLTQAAHEAGFSDSAHFSRTFRRMFGVAPAALRMT